MWKLEIKCGIEKNLLELLGGYKTIPKILNKMKNLIQSGDAF